MSSNADRMPGDPNWKIISRRLDSPSPDSEVFLATVEDCVARARVLLEEDASASESAKGEHEESVTSQFIKDVPRSFGGALSTQNDQSRMMLALTAFSLYARERRADRPELVYTQGQGFLIRAALEEDPSSEGAVTSAVCLLIHACESVPRGFYTRATHDEIGVFGRLVATYMPAIRAHLSEDFESAMSYLIPRWFLSCFVFALPKSVTKRVWEEVLFAQREEDLAFRLHAVALALLELHAAPLLSAHRQLTQSLGDARTEWIVRDQLAGLTGMEFVQRVAEAASMDRHADRLVRLATKDASITPEQVRRLRGEFVEDLARQELRRRLAARRLQAWFRARRPLRRASASEVSIASALSLSESSASSVSASSGVLTPIGKSSSLARDSTLLDVIAASLTCGLAGASRGKPVLAAGEDGNPVCRPS